MHGHNYRPECAVLRAEPSGNAALTTQNRFPLSPANDSCSVSTSPWHASYTNRLSCACVEITSLHCRMNEALLLLKQNTHRHQKLNVHCFMGALWDYQLWDGQFPRTAVGFTNKTTQTTEFATLARRLDLHWLVLETDSGTTTRGTHARWCIRLSG